MGINAEELPEGWQRLPFEHCLSKNTHPLSNVKIPTTKYLETGKYPVIDQGKEFIAGYVDDQSKVLNYSQPIIIFGDHTKILKFIDFPFCIGADGVKILIPRQELNPKFFYYHLMLTVQELDDRGYSRNYRYLVEKELLKPPIETQQKIVAKLDTFFEHYNELKKQHELEKTRVGKIIRAAISKLIPNSEDDLPEGWKMESLGFCMQPRKDKWNPGDTTSSYVDLESIEAETGNLINKKESTEIKSTKNVFKKGDVLYGKLRPYLNKIWIADFDGVCSTDILSLTTKDGVNPTFLAYCLRKKDFVEFAVQNSNGIQLPRVSFKIMSEYQIPIPSYEIQKQVANTLETVYSELILIKKELERKERALEILPNVVLRKAFRGELVA